MANLVSHSKSKYATGACIASSETRNWDNFIAEIWSHDSGMLEDTKPVDTEIVIMLAGRAEVTRKGDGKLQHAHAVPGTIWLCPAGIQESDIQIDGQIPQCLHLYIPARPFSDSALMEYDIDPNHMQISYEGGFHDPLIEQIARSVFHELHQDRTDNSLLLDSLQTSLAAHVITNYSNLRQKQMQAPRAEGTLDQRRLKRVTQFIDARLEQNLSLQALAAEACLSPFHFARAFKAATGATPHQFVVKRRVERAQFCLINKNLSLKELAQQCGFSSQSHFTKIFRKHVGMTPTDFRNNS